MMESTYMVNLAAFSLGACVAVLIIAGALAIGRLKIRCKFKEKANESVIEVLKESSIELHRRVAILEKLES